LVEPIGGLLGVSVVTIAHALLPWGLAFAGGAMLFVISSEIIPETHRHGHPLEATFGVISGFIVMTFLITYSAENDQIVINCGRHQASQINQP